MRRQYGDQILCDDCDLGCQWDIGEDQPDCVEYRQSRRNAQGVESLRKLFRKEPLHDTD